MKKIIAIVGMPGAGKTEASSLFAEKGWEILRFGSVIDDGIKEEGLEWSAENNSYYRKKIRKELGMAAVAIKMLPKIEKAINEDRNIILDGLYSWEEYVYLNDKLGDNIILLCIYARPSVRYQRLLGRKERVFSNKEARQRDIHELENTNKGGPIAIADHLIKNETTREDLYKELDKFLELVKNDQL